MNESLEHSPGRAGPAAVRVPESRVDFSRRLVCILGLPFDALTLDEAVARVRRDALSARRCFVSTPNLNFAIAARSDADFRGAVLRSDLSLVDGMPLVWIARLLRLPVPMRVAGSDLFEALAAHPGPAISVYLFGGPDGAAASACERINLAGGGLRCVGFEMPGTGSVESMSAPAHLERINRSGAHFVVVALGAKKGQAWIEANAGRLSAPVLSHLGAVLNFSAGSVRRAPPWMQRVGLEWLWRIREEPVLWRRYLGDGLKGIQLLLSIVMPEAVEARAAAEGHGPPAAVELRFAGGACTVAIRGAWETEAGMDALAEALEECARHPHRSPGLTVDLSQVTAAGNALAARLLVACGWFDRRGGFRLMGASRAVAVSLRRKGLSLEG